jgi:hypothetical protein
MNRTPITKEALDKWFMEGQKWFKRMSGKKHRRRMIQRQGGKH